MTRDWRRPLLVAVVAGVGFLLMAPTLILVPMSFSESPLLDFPPTGFTGRWYQNFFADPTWTEPAVNSLKVALLTVLVATVLGTLTALALVRGRFPGKRFVDAFVLGPAIVPVLLIGIGMFFVYSRLGLFGTLPGLVLAHTTLALPLVVVTVSASLRTIDRNLEAAAANLGANPARTFVHVTLPLIAPGVLAGALFAFVTSWDEVVMSIFLTSPGFHTLPVEIWSQLRFEIDPTVAAVSTMLIGVTIFVLLLSLGLRRLTPGRRARG